MPLARRRRILLQRVAAVLVAVLGVPFLVAAGTFAQDAPIREGEPAPRTVAADVPIRIVDDEATELARSTAAESVPPVRVPDDEAPAETLREVRSVFSAVRAAREPDPPPVGEDGQPLGPPAPPPSSSQLEQLRERLPQFDDEALRALIGLSDRELEQVEDEVVAIAQQISRSRFSEEELPRVLDDQLRVELALRNFPEDIARTVVEPLIREAMQPTVKVDPEATRAARERAAEDVAEVVRTWQVGQAIVREGELVEPIEFQALRETGLEGSDPWFAFLKGLAIMALTVLVVAIYLRAMQPAVWASGRKVLLLSSLVGGYALLVTGARLLVDATSHGWWYAVPAGGLAMLAAILVAPVVGIATMLPAVALVLVVAPQVTGVAVFVAATVLVSVPLVTRISSRGELRSATMRAAVAYPLISVATVLVFGPREDLGAAVTAAVVGGVVTALTVQGLLPFLETAFRLPTVTALLDLADRNHPLLRELEQKALGTYNHSVMVASLVERACRQIGANALLGSVAALYHDIGKVRQPHFFIENQQGIVNPHDDLEPEVSAVIIQNHVVDGIELAREYKLPPEVVACIGSHHGTMLVTFFYRQALDRVGGDIEQVDIDHFRYKGTKPRSKEAAVLLMADCCEATTRSAAMARGTLPRQDIETMVDRLLQERVDDGQFDDCHLTFAEMSHVRDQIVEALVGIYHPRIAYPERAGDEEEPAREPDRVAST